MILAQEVIVFVLDVVVLSCERYPLTLWGTRDGHHIINKVPEKLKCYYNMLNAS